MAINKQKLTGREQRMQHFQKMQAGSGINLVSMMDIFTILVFFLLVNTGAQQLPTSKDIRLPVSVATKTPEENLVITVSKDSILVQGKKVALVKDVMAMQETIIPSLSDELKLRAAGARVVADRKGERSTVMIMGDENIPYDLLRRILASCQDARYSQIQFVAHLSAKGKV